MSVFTFEPPGDGLSRHYQIGIVLRDFRLGGSERVAIGLANYWSSMKLNVLVIAGRAEGPLRPLLNPEIDVISGDISPARGDVSLAWVTAFVARRVFSKRQVDACYVPGNSHWPVIPVCAALPPARRPVFVAQISSPVCRASRSRFRQSLYDWRMRLLLRKADRITTLSEELAQEVSDIMGGRDVQIVPLPALWDEGTPIPLQPGSMNILAAGRLVPIKGFDVLIKAFRLVADHCPDASLTLCGEGPERGALEILIKELGLDNRVLLTGYVPSIRPYLDRCRVFTLTSHCESYGAVLLEALAAGRQTVATRCSPAVGAFITCDKAGKVVPPGDSSALAKALIDILSRPAPSCADLSKLVTPFHVSHGAQIYLSLMRPNMAFRRWGRRQYV